MMALGLILTALPDICFSAGEEEFVGPFSNWSNVKTDFGAVGNGVVDDTAAIQAAFDSLQTYTQSCILYFPAGTYRITDTVWTHRTNDYNCTGITIVGEDPATTIIRWAGQTNGFMIEYDAWYSKISRLTLDGAGKVAVGLAYVGSWSTYNETSDMIFQDMKDGIQLGTNGIGQAENTVLRCKFKRCSGAGLRTTDWNSLDIWVWYCQFEDCGYGVYNYCGNFHVYQSLFRRSKIADIGKLNLMVFSFVNNVSIGSACFLDFSDGFTSGSPVSITGNRIINTTGDFAIRLANGGPYLVMDNIIKSRSGKVTPEVEMTWGDQIFVSNTYTIANAVSLNGRYRVVGDQVVNPSTIDTNPPVMPATPTNYHRTVFEVLADSDETGIQAAINSAAALKGNNPVVHLPVGSYNIHTTLVVPAGCDMQIVGDGGAETTTCLGWYGGGTGPLLKLEGPSKAVVRDLYINTDTATGIQIKNCDQVGGRILGDQVNVAGNSNSGRALYGFFVNGVENADVLIRCLEGGGYCRNWVAVAGGPQRQAGNTTPGQVSILTGASATDDQQYSVSKGGRLVARSMYHEVSDHSVFRAITLNDAGILSVDATKFAYAMSTTQALFTVNSFTGQFTLLTSLLVPDYIVNSSPRVQITGNGSRCNVLCAGNIFYEFISNPNADSAWLNTASPAATNAAMLNCNANIQPSPYYIAFANRGTASDAFILKMLQPIHETRVWLPQQTDATMTDVRLHRVMIRVWSGNTGIGVEAVGTTGSVTVVTITSPTDGAAFTEGTNITINATASVGGGTVSRVDFYQGSTKLGQDTSSPYSYIWNSVAAGAYSLTAKAININSVTTTSVAVSIKVNGVSTGGTNDTLVVSSADDAEENVTNGAVSVTSSDLELTWDDHTGNFNQLVGMRFAGIDIPAGAVINNAWIQFTAEKTTNRVGSLTIKAEASDDAATFTAGANSNISLRGKTSASVSWNPPDWTVLNEAGANQRTPNIASLIQEVVNRSGWASGNALAVIISGNTGERVAYSWDGANTAGNLNYAPLLHVEYVMGSTNRTPHGVPYSWLSIYGITNNQSQAETNDPDGDGAATWKEYYAGTAPNAKSSVFKILSFATNGTVKWYGTTNSGVTNGFRIYRRTNLLSGSWTLMASNITRAANGTNTWTDPSPPSPNIYYKPTVPVSP
jgi:hypothetical protein